MKKHIFIVNGMARSGKDTFAEILGTMVPTMKYSSIDKVKGIATLCGWDGGKTEKDRKFLSDLKCLTTEYSDMPFRSISKKVESFLDNYTHAVLLIDIREPKEIDRAKQAFDAEAILIMNNRVENITSNMADANVYNYTYDYVIENNGTLDEFRENIKEFVNELVF
jgi:dephospho-CoA kinase